jgi:hypothetical protein
MPDFGFPPRREKEILPSEFAKIAEERKCDLKYTFSAALCQLFCFALCKKYHS